MKTYQCKKRVSPQLKKEILNTIKTNALYKGCHFWQRDNGNVSSRAWKTQKFYAKNPDYTVVCGDSEIVVKPWINIRRTDTHYNLNITRDGKKSNIKILKSLINYGA